MAVNSLRTCLVDHIPLSYGISLTMDSANGAAPFKLTFSGDTMPCESLCELGKDSTLLIHEATFDNTMTERARFTKHSTIGEAVQQGVKMNAKHTILTHISRRYHFIPPIDGDLDGNVGMAFDFMEIIESDLSELNSIFNRVREEYNKSKARHEEVEIE